MEKTFKNLNQMAILLRAKKLEKIPVIIYRLEKEKFCRLPLKVDLKNYQVFIMKFQQNKLKRLEQQKNLLIKLLSKYLQIPQKRFKIHYDDKNNIIIEKE